MLDTISRPQLLSSEPGVANARPARIKWVDIYKGLAMFSVVVGHSNGPLSQLVYTFHLPAFFFISGYATRLDSVTLGVFARRRIDTLLTPFFCYNLLFIALTALLSFHPAFARILAQPFSPAFFEASLRQLLVDIEPPTDFGGATWFLPCLMVTAVFGWVLTHLAKALSLKPIWVVILALWPFLYILTPGNLGTPWILDADLACIGVFYYVLGAYCRARQVFENHIRPGVGLVIALLILYSAGTFYWIKAGYTERTFSSPSEVLIGALAGIYALYHLSKLLAAVKWASAFWVWIGENSLVILALHFLAFRFCFFVLHALKIANDAHLSQVIPMDSTKGYWFVISVVSTLLPLAFASGCRCSPFLSRIFLAK